MIKKRIWLAGLERDLDLPLYPGWAMHHGERLTILDENIYKLYTQWHIVSLSRWNVAFGYWTPAVTGDAHSRGLSVEDWMDQILTNLPTILVLEVL